ncbi:hypothetical protein ID866_13312 [Astraeus odoratus]|nr:hypothetical protein ID866_13312 [Astraeus odoratus]
MSAFCRTPSPNDMATTKVKDPWQRMEEDWTLILEAELDPVSSDDEGMVQLRKQQRLEVWRDEHRWKQDEEWREAEERRAHEEVAKKAREESERQAKEVHKVQEEAAKKEREEREVAAWKAQEAVEAWADAEWRALEEKLWDAAAQCSEMAVAPLQVAKPGGRMSVAGPSIPG